MGEKDGRGKDEREANREKERKRERIERPRIYVVRAPRTKKKEGTRAWQRRGRARARKKYRSVARRGTGGYGQIELEE